MGDGETAANIGRTRCLRISRSGEIRLCANIADAGDTAEWGYNVVIHEFAHVLDMRDGAADGVPLLPDRAARDRWLEVLEGEWAAFCRRVDAGDETLLDPYGAEAIDEFFAVAAERELYPRKTLERASTICTSCMGVVKAVCLRTAIEQGIPMIGYGWSPGQAPVQSSIMRTNPGFARMAQETVLRPLREAVGEEVAAWFLAERHFADPERFPWNVHPLAWEHYDEGEILREIAALGWRAPADTDPNSTNCLLNALGNEVHQRRHGFHPYVWEIANMVREGVMSREEGYAKIYAEQRSELVDAARAALGLPGPGANGT